MFTYIKIKNFRCFEDFEVSGFKRVNLLVGNNNSGKTSLLEALFLSSQPGYLALFLDINHIRGIRFHVLNDSMASFFETFFFQGNIENIIQISHDSFQEELHASISPHYSPTGIFSGLDGRYRFRGKEEIATVIYDIPKSKEAIVNNLRYRPNMSIPLSFKGPEFDKADCQFIGSFVPLWEVANDDFLKIQENNQLSLIISILQKINKDIRSVFITPLGFKCDTGLPVSLQMEALGEGVQRIFQILTRIIKCQNGIVFIDEIENGLHPTSQVFLWKAIFEFAEKFNVQVFATTHSWDCLQAVSEASEKSDTSFAFFNLFKKDSEIRSRSLTEQSFQEFISHGWEVR